MLLHRREGAAVVSVQNQGSRETALGQHRLPDQDGGQFRTFAFMDFPAHDFAAEDVRDQLEIEEHARDRPGHPGDIRLR